MVIGQLFDRESSAFTYLLIDAGTNFQGALQLANEPTPRPTRRSRG
jgi:hypothetical protein